MSDGECCSCGCEMIQDAEPAECFAAGCVLDDGHDGEHEFCE